MSNLRKTLRGRLPYQYGQVAINTEVVRFAYRKAARL